MWTLLKIFFTFFKIGLFTFGGGYAMIPMIQSEMIKAGYLTMEQTTQFIGISEATPGPFAINIATFSGFHVLASESVFMQILGASVATLGVVLPSFLIILLIAAFSDKVLKTGPVKNALMIIQPMVLGFIFAAFLSVSLSSILGHFMKQITFDYIALIIFGITLATGLLWKKASPVILILLSMTLGLILYAIL